MSYICKDKENLINMKIEKSKDNKTLMVEATDKINGKLYGEFLWSNLKDVLKKDDYIEAKCKGRMSKKLGKKKRIESFGIIGRKEDPIMHTVYLKVKDSEYGEVINMDEDDFNKMLAYLKEAS